MEELNTRLQEVSRLRQLASDYGLAGRERLGAYTDEQLARIYNGCGPERWPFWVREKIDGLVGLYAPVILIHDVQFHESDGTDVTFDEVCDMFETNVDIIMGIHYPLFTWDILKPAYRAERAYWKTMGILLSSAVRTHIARKEYRRQHEEG